MGEATERAVTVRPVAGGCDVQMGDTMHAVRFDWRFGDILMDGTFDGMPFAIQVERLGLKYRLTHRGTQIDFQVLPRRAAELLQDDAAQGAAGPVEVPALADARPAGRGRGAPGQEVKAGERLVVIEAMKMQNVLLAERDGMVAELLAEAGESLAVDQAILRFE